MPIYSRYSPVGGGSSYTFVGVAPISVVDALGTVTTSMTQADALTDGWLSSVDWSAFNSKQAAGNYITALTGEVTATGPGSVVATIAGQSGNSGKFLVTNGTTVSFDSVVNEAAANIDFRVEGQTDTNLLFTDASVNRVGIGNNTPAEKLHVSGNVKLVSALLDGSVSGTLTQSAADTTTSYAVKWPSAQGAAATVLQNDGSGNLSWSAAPPASGWEQVYFGDGSDGDLTVTTNNATSGPITNGKLTRDAYFNNLTISGSGEIYCGVWRLYVKDTLDLTAAGANAINSNGNSAGNASGSSGGTGGSSQDLDSGFLTPPFSGASGAAGTTGAGTSGSNSQFQPNSVGGRAYGGGAGGAGTAAGGAAGTTAAAIIKKIVRKYTDYLISPTISAIPIYAGARGGRGATGGGDGSNSGGGGGGAGNGGGIVYMGAKTIDRGASTTAGAISAKGGNSGNGGTPTAGDCGGGGGAAGSGGGYVYVFYYSLAGSSATNAVDVSGGTGGNGGDGIGTGLGGNGGGGGGGGSIALIDISTGGATIVDSAALGTAGSAASGITGGAGGAGETLQSNL